MSVRAAGIPRASALAVTETVPLTSVLSVMAVANLCVWAAHCTPEASSIHESAPEPPEVAASAPEPPEMAGPLQKHQRWRLPLQNLPMWWRPLMNSRSVLSRPFLNSRSVLSRPRRPFLNSQSWPRRPFLNSQSVLSQPRRPSTNSWSVLSRPRRPFLNSRLLRPLLYLLRHGSLLCLLRHGPLLRHCSRSCSPSRAWPSIPPPILPLLYHPPGPFGFCFRFVWASGAALRGGNM